MAFLVVAQCRLISGYQVFLESTVPIFRVKNVLG